MVLQESCFRIAREEETEGKIDLSESESYLAVDSHFEPCLTSFNKYPTNGFGSGNALYLLL